MSQDKSKANREINNIDEFHSWALDMQKRVRDFGSQFNEPHIVKELIEECLRQETFDEALLKPKFEYIQKANNERVDRSIHQLIPNSKVFFDGIENLKRNLKFQYPVNPAECFIEECEKALNSLGDLPSTDHSLIGLNEELQLAKEALNGNGYFPVWRHLYNFSHHYEKNKGRMYAVILDSKNKAKLEQSKINGKKASNHWTPHIKIITKYVDLFIRGNVLQKVVISDIGTESGLKEPDPKSFNKWVDNRKHRGSVFKFK